jgi:hypothetical protein
MSPFNSMLSKVSRRMFVFGASILEAAGKDLRSRRAK